MISFATLGESFRSFFDAINQFFSSLSAVQWVPLLVGLLCYGTYLTIRSRASYHVLRAAYPNEDFRWREIWGAFLAGYGVNAVIPARPGDIVRLFLTKTSIPNSSYAAVGAASITELIFDWSINLIILPYAFTQGVFPKPPDFAKLNAFDLSYFAQHPQFTLFVLTAIGVGVITGIALLSARFRAFLHASVLACPSGFPARVDTRTGCLPSCRRKTSSTIAFNDTAMGLRFLA